MTTKPSKLRVFKIGLNITLFTALSVILIQNDNPVDMKILFWEAHIPLVVLLLITAVLSALTVLVFVMILGRN